MTIESTISFLRKNEWTMGNGQCPDCYGLSPYGRWEKHPCNTEGVGHKRSCDRAIALEGLGEEVIYIPKATRYNRDNLIPVAFPYIFVSPRAISYELDKRAINYWIDNIDRFYEEDGLRDTTNGRFISF